jgi:hypothetical protein
MHSHILMREKDSSDIWLKISIAALLIIYFFLGYFITGTIEYSNPLHLEIFIDYMIPFVPLFIISCILGDAMAFA